MKADYPSVLLIYTGGTIGMIENPETGALENFNFAIGAGDGHAQHLRHRVRVEEQRQLVIVGECGFLHFVPPFDFC